MAQALISDQYRIMSGSQPAFLWDDQILNPPGYRPMQTGSPLGVPPAASIAGQTANGAQQADAYASQVQARGTASHPILWLIILMVIGLLGLGMVAHLEVKRRG